MSNLLDRASVVLTPTAYNNGEALCIKPDDGSGDFTFSRNSAATRVNAQGLVENVQILSSNLVQNGDFSEEGSEEVSNGSFSQEGSELITNGDFATDSDWFKSGQVTIGGGVAYFDSDGTFTQIAQNLSGISGKSAKVVIEITEYNQGTLKVLFSGGAQQNLPTSVGTHTLYFSNVASNTLNIARVGGVTNIKIDNVSCVEVGQDWDLGTGWSIGEDKVIVTSTANQQLKQTLTTTIGKSYKVSLEILDITEGAIRIYLRDGGTAYFVGGTYASSGVYDFYFTSTETLNTFAVYPLGITTASITNISVKEVGQNWDLGTGWSIGENKAIQDGTGSGISGWLRQQPLTIGKTYAFSCYVETSDVGVVGSVNDNWTSFISFNNGSGEYTTTFTPQSTEINFAPQSSKSYSVTNISVIEITDDTNLPRINYENFSYQDALGSEEISNGDFATDSDWIKGTGWSISGGTANCDGTQTSNSNLLQSNTATSGNTYKITYTITNYVSGTFKSVLGVGGVVRNSNGVYSEYITATSSSFLLQANSDFIGSIDNVSVKEYLGQSVVPGSGCGSWLFEPASRNLVPYSEDFSDASWLMGESTITSNYATSPSGNNDASRWLSNSGASSSAITAGPTVLDNTAYTISFYVKSNGNNKDVFRLIISSGADGLVSNDLTATSKWQRFTYSGTRLTTGTRFGLLFPSDNSEVDLQIWGAQLEQQSYATSYIPNFGEANGVSRNQDVCTGGGSLASINSTEGTLYFEFKPNSADISVVSISDGSTSNFIQIYIPFSASSLRYRATTSGVVQFDNQINTAINLTLNHKYAIKWKLNDFSLWVDGIKINSQLIGSTPIGLNQINFYNVFGGGSKVNGKTKALAVFPYLSDAELTELTTI